MKFFKQYIDWKFALAKHLLLLIGLLFISVEGRTAPIQINEAQNHYFIKPQLEYWRSPGPLASSPDAVSLNDFKPLRSTNNYLKGGAWLRFQIDFRERSDTLYLVSERNNILYNFQLFQPTHTTGWATQYADYHQPEIHRNQPWGRVVFKIPPRVGVQTFYLALEGDHFASPELILLTRAGLAEYSNQATRSILFYGSVVVLILFLSLLIGIFFRIKLAFLLAFYVFCTAAVSLLEFIVYLIPGRPDLTYQLSIYLFPIFVLSFLLYSKAFLQLGTLPKWGENIYNGLIVGLLIYTIGVEWISHYNQVDLIVTSVLGYGTVLIFVASALYSWRSNKAILWFIAGALAVTVTILLIDLHDRNIIFAPWAFEYLYPGILLELILIAIGTLLGVKQKARELDQTNSENIRLKQDLQHLQQAIEQSKSAFQTLANRKMNTPLTAPDEYYDNPLSTRELQVLRLLSQGLTNVEISEQLHLSRNTIKTHLKKIYQKLQTNNRKEAASKARAYGLIE